MILAYEQWVVRVFGLTLSYSNFAYIVAQKKKKKKRKKAEMKKKKLEQMQYLAQYIFPNIPTSIFQQKNAHIRVNNCFSAPIILPTY